MQLKPHDAPESRISSEQGRPKFIKFKVLLTLGVILLLAGCSSGLEEELPELETAAATKSTESRISSDRDDAEERTSGLVINSSTDIELTDDKLRGQQLIGLRFNNVKVPRGAKIKKAYIQFKADETDSGSIEVRIRAEDTNSASSFVQGRNKSISKRNKTSASKNWKIDKWSKRGERGSKQRTPDLSSLVKEVTSRKGWDRGNSMAFIISSGDEKDRRVAESYRGDKKGAPMLYVEYSGGDSSSSGNSSPVSSGPKIKSSKADYYVSPKNGNDRNPGTKDKPLKTIYEVAKRVRPGDVVFLRGGTYKGKRQSYAGYDRPFARDGKKGAPITIMSYPGERAVIDGGDKSWKDHKSVSSPVLLRVTGDHYVVENLTLKDGAGRGLYVSGDNNIIRGIETYGHHSDGIYVNGDDNLVENVKSYDNYSRQNGGDSADGIKVAAGDRNVIRNCRVYKNSDDGVDIWRTRKTLVENCTSSQNGHGKSGNGRGFKMSQRNMRNTGNVLRDNVAKGNKVNYDANRGTGITLYNNESHDADYTGYIVDSGNKAYNNKSSGDPKNNGRFR